MFSCFINLLFTFVLSTKLADKKSVIDIYNPNAVNNNAGIPIKYHGGTVLQGTVGIYVIYYGSWKDSSIQIINGFITSVTESGCQKSSFTITAATCLSIVTIGLRTCSKM